MLLSDRVEVLAGPWDTQTVQTIAAFASLHVAVMVTICLVSEQMRLPALIRVAAWTFLALTMVATIYLGWHFFVDVLAGVAVGAAAFVLAARATGNPLRRREEPWTFRAALDVSAYSEDRPVRRAPQLTSPDRVPHRAARSRSAYAAASPSAYFVRGQKKPRSPSPLVRGTTWRCRCGTDWLTVLLIGHEGALGAEAVLHRRRQLLGRGQEAVARPRPGGRAGSRRARAARAGRDP